MNFNFLLLLFPTVLVAQEEAATCDTRVKLCMNNFGQFGGIDVIQSYVLTAIYHPNSLVIDSLCTSYESFKNCLEEVNGDAAE